MKRRVRNLRRPTTIDTDKFWHISKDRWWKLIVRSELSEPRQSRSSETLKRYDAAGRIMETEEGTLPVIACTSCDERKDVCRVFAEGEEHRCAFCIIRNFNCNAERAERVESQQDTSKSLLVVLKINPRLATRYEDETSPQTQSGTVSEKETQRTVETSLTLTEKVIALTEIVTALQQRLNKAEEAIAELQHKMRQLI